MKHTPELIAEAKTHPYDLTKVKDRILYLADLIEDKLPRPAALQGIGFDMQSPYAGVCGSACCIAGHIALLQGERKWTTDSAGKWLGLHRSDAKSLFYPQYIETEKYPEWRTMYQATPAEGAAVLRHLAETGVVDWAVAGGVS